MDGTIRTSAIRDSGLSTTGFSSKSVTTSKVADGVIQTTDIEDGGIIAASFGTEAVTADKLGGGSVRGNNFQNESIASNKIGSASIETGKLMDLSIVAENLQDGTISSEQIADGVVGSRSYANAAVDVAEVNPNDPIEQSKLEPGVVVPEILVVNSITTLKLADGAVTGDKIMEAEVESRHLSVGLGSIQGSQIEFVESDVFADAAFTAAKVSAATSGQITTGMIDDESIDTSLILDGAVTGDKFGNAAIMTDTIYDVEASDFRNGAVTTSNIADGVVQGVFSELATDNLQANVVCGPQLATGSVTKDSILERSIDSAQIEDGSVNQDMIGIHAVTTSKFLDLAVDVGTIKLSTITTDNFNNLAVQNDDLQNADKVNPNKAKNTGLQQNNFASQSIQIKNFESYLIDTFQAATQYIGEAAANLMEIKDECCYQGVCIKDDLDLSDLPLFGPDDSPPAGNRRLTMEDHQAYCAERHLGNAVRESISS